MKGKISKKLLCALLTLIVVVGLIPAVALATGGAASGTPGESAQNPILISTMDQLIEEMEKNVSTATYYKLTEDISHETSIETLLGSEDQSGDDGYTTVRKPYMAQCVVGTGKKFLELDGYDIHYKNNANFNLRCANSKYGSYSSKYDSLTFFYLGEGCDLTVSNTTGDDAEVWYDGWMHNRTNFLSGPNYIYTAVRDVFRVETGAELTVNNTDIKAGRNRKIWMVNSFYLDKDKETNLLVKLTYNGYAYEQIYGSAIVANGGKVTINGGYIEGRGGYRNFFNVSGVPEYNLDSITDVTLYGNFERNAMIENCLSNVGGKAAVQIAGEGSTVIINDGEFWGCGGADVIGINGLNGGGVDEYTLRINAGTFDTSKTDKERLPDRCAGNVNSGPWPWSHANWRLWANCRCIRDTLRGNIGIPAVDGYGNNVFNTKKVHVYIDDEEEEDEVTKNEDLDFRYKSDSDTIIVKPREAEDYWNTDAHIWGNYRGDSHYRIYVYAKGEEISDLLDYVTHTKRGFYYEPAVSQGLYFSAESHYDLTEEDNPYFQRAYLATCRWVLYEEDENGNLINTYTQTSSPFHTEHKDGHTVYNFKLTMNSFKNVAWNEYHDYYMVAVMEERFDSVVHSYLTESYPTGVLDHDSYHYGIAIKYDPDYCSSFASSGAEVTYSNAAYNCDPVLTFSDEYSKLKGSKTFQWQVLENGEWVDYGQSRISPELAVEVLRKHAGLTGKQVRLKITSYDGIYDDALYSNACEVQPDRNTAMPNTGTYTWREDPNNSGKYILESSLNNGTQEYLIRLHENSWDPSALDWSNAVDTPVFADLEAGYYDIFTRYKATADYTAGTEVVRSKAVVGPYTLTQGFEIRHNDKPVDEIIVEVGKEFRLSAVANPEDATDKSIIYNVRWSPESDKTQMISASWLGTYQKFENNYTGASIWLRGDEVGVVTVQALTTLDDGTNARHKVTVRIVPEGFVPYTVTVVNNGAKVEAGARFDPLLRLHDRKASRLDGDLIPETGIKEILQSQILARQITWTLVGNNLTYDRLRPIVSNGAASMHMETGRIVVNEDATPGTVIRYVGYLDDPYLGRITIPGSITVVAAPEPEVHTHEYSGYAQNDDSTHYRVCDCGEKTTEAHEYTAYTIREATGESNALYGYACPCGHSYEAEQEGTARVHTHSLIYAYDLTQHWQLCDGDDCPEADYATAKQNHSFVSKGTDPEGKEIFACSVCGAVKLDDRIAVAITSQPKDAAAYKGSAAAVTVQASGDSLTYAWYFKNKGAAKFSKTSSFTGNTYSVSMDESRDGRQIYCVITDAYGNSVQSDTVTLHMAVAITTQPKTTYTKQGATAKTTVTATGDGLKYQWFVKNAGATSWSKSSITANTYSVKMTATTKDRMVYCVITDKYGKTAQTDVVYLRLAATITEQPADVVVKNGEKATVKVTAVGDGLTYRWYYKNKGDTDYTYTSSFTGNTYSITMTDARAGRRVLCRVYDKYGNVVASQSALLSQAVRITKQPASVVVANGEKATVKVTAVGDGLTYRWYYKNKGDTDYTYTSSFTGNTYSITMTDARAGRRVLCRVYDKYGNVVASQSALLSQAVRITMQPASITVANGTTAKTSVTAVGDGLTYQWYVKNAGATKWTKSSITKSSYSITMSAAADGRKIYCVVTDKYGKTVTSKTVTLSME